ncbi:MULTISPECIES: DUF3817 domain-containing protein [unclassified Frankia]|uniref:DUF3817 domain-containing protein n=1 Tax=unclassified Frankia TaxID=2632575 RepID=UPI002AD3E308|nr:MULTISPECIES: DUF3817 domain-containing protein [unclassified Frankia]
MPAASNTRTNRGEKRLLATAQVVSIAEATSFLLLLVATTIKYGAGHPGGVRILGPIHGGLFLAYCAIMIALARSRRWPMSKTLLALGAAVLPIAPYIVERRWLHVPAAGHPPTPAGSSTTSTTAPTPGTAP